MDQNINQWKIEIPKSVLVIYILMKDLRESHMKNSLQKMALEQLYVQLQVETLDPYFLLWTKLIQKETLTCVSELQNKTL